ncbi:putative sodium-dependent multivitamin transporter [Caerostris extrusa]|uniref:Sodium-dependent multivitamin transporter n=1 Tax=Caerostris extrusa TaxID=172846 RepID=A0AAV4MTB1_CAEEX|nr:putative sodium-dependent multivitamin transporter [Caerostris extrusa]
MIPEMRGIFFAIRSSSIACISFRLTFLSSQALDIFIKLTDCSYNFIGVYKHIQPAMTNLLGITDFVVIGAMLSVSAMVGLYFRFTEVARRRRTNSLMAGRNMHIGPVAFSLMATHMSAISVLGMPAETYMYGTQFVMWMIGMPLGGLVAAYGFLPVFFDMNVSTAYEVRYIRAGLFQFKQVINICRILRGRYNPRNVSYRYI